MKYLLDTHTAFWEFADSPNLPNAVKAIIDDKNNEIFVSLVSAWEIAIKRSLKRDKSTLCSVDEFFYEVVASGFNLITLEPSHIRCIETMPNHHKDPFDRMLIATAIIENMIFLSADENVSSYDVKWFW